MQLIYVKKSELQEIHSQIEEVSARLQNNKIVTSECKHIMRDLLKKIVHVLQPKNAVAWLQETMPEQEENGGITPTPLECTE
jgi:hypothetical protein